MTHLNNIKSKIKKHKLFTLTTLFLCAFLICGSVVLINNKSNTYSLDVNDLFEIHATGLDGKASASLQSVDKEQDVIEDILTSIYKDGSYDYETWYKYDSFFNDLEYFCEFNKDESISNGDIITAKIIFDKDEAKQLHIRFKNCKIETVVSGLMSVVDQNTNLTDNLKNNIDEGFFNSAQSYLNSIFPYGSTQTIKTIDKVWRKIVDYNYMSCWVEDVKLEKDPVLISKYRLDSEAESDSFLKFAYIYEVDIEATSLANNEQLKRVCYITACNQTAITTQEEKIVNIGTNITINDIYKTLDQAKQSLLNKGDYTVEEIN